MRRSGELVQWNNKGGYGFVRDADSRDYYLHISKMAGGDRPRLGDHLSFETKAGKNGRPAAINATVDSAAPVEAPTLRDVVTATPPVSRFRVGIRTTAATVLTLLILVAIGTFKAPVWFALIYVLMGTASALLYRADKLYALNGKYRVSETNLHLVDLSFGIIGGLIAQEVYRHKTVKPRFRATTGVIALVHVLGLVALAFGPLSHFFRFT